jgi:hypothetical protein
MLSKSFLSRMLCIQESQVCDQMFILVAQNGFVPWQEMLCVVTIVYLANKQVFITRKTGEDKQYYDHKIFPFINNRSIFIYLLNVNQIFSAIKISTFFYFIITFNICLDFSQKLYFIFYLKIWLERETIFNFYFFYSMITCQLNGLLCRLSFS